MHCEAFFPGLKRNGRIRPSTVVAGLVTRGSPWRQRRYPFDREPGTRCRSCGGDSQQRDDRRDCRPRRRSHVNGPGEYVSVRSQADSEEAALNLERAELQADNQGEQRELTAIYVGRGVDPALAKQDAEQLMAHDALAAHARDELGISEALRARPIQAAFTSAVSFAVGAAMPLLAVATVPASGLIAVVSGTSLIFLAILGGLAARVGGASVTMGAMRVTFWGALAMALTAGVGKVFVSVA